MQKNWRMVLITAIGLMAGMLPSLCFGQVIWQSVQAREPTIFCGYEKVLIKNLMPKNTEVQEAIKTVAGSKIQLIKEVDPQKQFEAIRNSHLSLYLLYIPTKNPRIHLLQLSARAISETGISKVDYVGTLWEKLYLIEEGSKQLLHDSLKNGLEEFFSQYLEANFFMKTTPTFYLFN